MSIKGKADSHIDLEDPKKLKIGIIQAQWNHKITDQMADECKKALLYLSIPEENIFHEILDFGL